MSFFLSVLSFSVCNLATNLSFDFSFSACIILRTLSTVADSSCSCPMSFLSIPFTFFFSNPTESEACTACTIGESSRSPVCACNKTPAWSCGTSLLFSRSGFSLPISGGLIVRFQRLMLAILVKLIVLFVITVSFN